MHDVYALRKLLSSLSNTTNTPEDRARKSEEILRTLGQNSTFIRESAEPIVGVISVYGYEPSMAKLLDAILAKTPESITATMLKTMIHKIQYFDYESGLLPAKLENVRKILEKRPNLRKAAVDKVFDLAKAGMDERTHQLLNLVIGQMHDPTAAKLRKRQAQLLQSRV